MTMKALFKNNLDEHLSLFSSLNALAADVERAGTLWANVLRTGGKLMFCGNGGSAADSQHLAAELTGRFIKDRKPLAAMALTTDTSALTCIGNDYSFDDVFMRQVLALGRKGDCLVAISTSGNSRNVVRAVEAAGSLGMHSLGLLGRDGGKLKAMCAQAIVVPSNTTARVQEAHLLIGHTLCGMAESSLGFA